MRITDVGRVMRARLAVAFAAIVGGIVTNLPAHAQPCIQPPASYVDLGNVNIGTTVKSADLPIAAGQTIWFRFQLTEAINAKTSWLDMDTARSTINTEMCVYNCRSYKVHEDDYSGGGTFLDSTASGLSFGAGSGKRLGEDGPGWFGAHISDGYNTFENVVFANLDPGVYFVAVAGFNADFSQNPNPNWQVSTNSTATGTVRLRIATGPKDPGQWNERYDGWDANSTPGTAQVVTGSGPLNRILFSGGVGLRDMFKINICDPAAFSVTATPTERWGRVYRARLYIFDSTGRGVVAINNTIQYTETVLTLPAGSPAGDYYVAATNYCTATVPPVPYDAAGQPLWVFPPNNAPIKPNGGGASNPVFSWGEYLAGCEEADLWIARLSFTGACMINDDEPLCYADCDGNGSLDIDDFVCFQTYFAVGC